MSVKVSLDERQSHIEKLCKDSIYTFVSWCEDYKNVHSKFICRCHKHGEWTISVHNFYIGKRCSRCKMDAQVISQEQREEQIKGICKSHEYVFVMWDGFYKGKKSKFLCECTKHGVWKPSVDGFVNGGRRCPGCASYGYDATKDATLYVLKSHCDRYVKIGVTNNLTRRLGELGKQTPFQFELVDCITSSGVKIWEIEKVFKRYFQTAGFNGFSGATEWYTMSDKFAQWLEWLR